VPAGVSLAVLLLVTAAQWMVAAAGESAVPAIKHRLHVLTNTRHFKRIYVYNAPSRSFLSPSSCTFFFAPTCSSQWSSAAPCRGWMRHQQYVRSAQGTRRAAELRSWRRKPWPSRKEKKSATVLQRRHSCCEEMQHLVTALHIMYVR
jgi:hypothetical protein